MSDLAYLLLLTSGGGILSLFLSFILLRTELLTKVHLYLVAFAAGTLIGAALFDLLPEAIEHGTEAGLPVDTPFLYATYGLILFFLLEKFLNWYHNHIGKTGDGERLAKAIVPAITIGDGLHNFLDGTIIAAATLTDPGLGLITAVAVFAHEVPQEVGDLSVLIFGGLNKVRALLVNLLTASTVYLGALAVWFLSDGIEALTLPLVGFTAGAFIFIALGELVPELIHKGHNGTRPLFLALTFILGIFLIRNLGTWLGLGH